MRALLTAAFAPVALEVIDDSHNHVGHAGARDGRGHFNVDIVSDGFAGAPLARHRAVYAALGDMMETDIHALSIGRNAGRGRGQGMNRQGHQYTSSVAPGVVKAIRTGISRASVPSSARSNTSRLVSAAQQQHRVRAGARPAGVRLIRRGHGPAPAQPAASTAT